ncbi:type VI secretion system Vgr family protein [Agarilytica rhodophyticola]|uniref:type VI secretion system Vgr family protein n=1 Tax=Agarilytica rhodophyticola TaxID=1737490 RepID=UPI000B347F50|nr:type VI secretion system tip protein TssI/VgrG [Agarilytica rhodophyticola]
MGDLTQDGRLISVSDFSLGKDTFILTHFDGVECISDIFNFELTMISENLNILPKSVVGRQVTVTVHGSYERSFHGYIRTFSHGEVTHHNMRQYKMRMVPWLWFLQKTSNCRIFQNKNTKEIVSQIFQDRGFSDFEFRSAGGLPREYCVQYNESDFDFISRLLEEEGIAYYFIHSKSSHKLILADQTDAYEEVAQTDLEYSSGSSTKLQITRWQHTHSYHKGQWSFSDYNFKEPKKKLYSNTRTTSEFADNPKYEHYEYAKMYDFSYGDDLVEIRLDAEEAAIDTIEGDSNCSSFFAGAKFKINKHECSSELGAYRITRVYHKAYDQSHLSDANKSCEYSNNFICIPAKVHFRPPKIHSKPKVVGPQSAIVTGPAGEEIYVDEFGRIKVQFYWDREGKLDENTTCFIRVMQVWAGAQWGASFIPRIGHEVIVDFVDGDCDRPIITGTVYNGKNRPPFDSKTKSGIRTRSTKGGSKPHCNELIFDDKKDNEQIFIHAEKDMDTEIENNETLTVENDRTKIIMHDENSTIENDRNKTVNNNQTEKIKHKKTIEVGDDHNEKIGKNMIVAVGKDLKEKVDDNHIETVKNDYKLKAKTIYLNADDRIVFKTGASKITMNSNGDIVISGKNIYENASTNVVMKANKITSN